MRIVDGDVIVFQGDSITDAGRDRADEKELGSGYANMVAAWFAASCPEKKVTFYNRGISGNRAVDVSSRWKEDTLSLKPTIVSLLVGINDTWRRYKTNDPTSVEAYETHVRDILQKTQSSCDATILLLEPFVLPIPEDRKEWREDLDPKIHALRQLAVEFNTIYVPLDGIFASVCPQKPAAFWAEDGVHPSAAGHALIAQTWLQAMGITTEQ
ncbi:lysophospholipase L1-like esterase [Aureibacillus halotolerans]|uniref:Lysophospholipase L1-like esterase n=2 Tax=Aureibacillus halotolerans TaxID=1508390 RepID=A0A4R6UCW6_9BACI|nr:lysophospholipase L1-like esterase [Aureibacillus halotolerans]